MAKNAKLKPGCWVVLRLFGPELGIITWKDQTIRGVLASPRPSSPCRAIGTHRCLSDSLFWWIGWVGSTPSNHLQNSPNIGPHSGESKVQPARKTYGYDSMMALNQLEKRMTGKSTFFWVTTLFPLLLIFPRSRTGTRSLEIWTGKAFWSRCTHRWKSRAKLLPPFLAVFERLIRATFSTWKSTTPPGVLKSLGIHLEIYPPCLAVSSFEKYYRGRSSLNSETFCGIP